MSYFIYIYLFYIAAVFSILVYRKWQKKELNIYNKIAFAPIIGTFYLLDVAINMTLLNLVMGQTPSAKYSISDRFQFYNNANYGWKSKVANFVCTKLLDTVDPTGDHC